MNQTDKCVAAPAAAAAWATRQEPESELPTVWASLTHCQGKRTTQAPSTTPGKLQGVGGYNQQNPTEEVYWSKIS